MLAVQLVLGGRDGTLSFKTYFPIHIEFAFYRSVTLVGETDRKMLKAAIKRSSAEDQVRHRIVPTETIQTWVEKLALLKEDIAGILVEEKEEKHVGVKSILRVRASVDVFK